MGWRIKRLDLARPQQVEVWADGFFTTAMFSPDGRWVVYGRWSEGAGTRVYVRSFQGPGAERPVSVNSEVLVADVGARRWHDLLQESERADGGRR